MTAKSTGYQKLLAAALGPHYIVRAEVLFHPTRRWRFDLTVYRCATPVTALPDGLMEYKAFIAHNQAPLAVEIDGGGFAQGRHSRGLGIENDCAKYAEAMLRGWRILRVTPRQVKNGQAVKWVEQLLAAGGPSAQAGTSER